MDQARQLSPLEGALAAGEFDDGGTDVPGGVAGPVRRVLVIGAGIAGLTAANALTHAGVECVVLEAQRPDRRPTAHGRPGRLACRPGRLVDPHAGREPDDRVRAAGGRALRERGPGARDGRLRLRRGPPPVGGRDRGPARPATSRDSRSRPKGCSPMLGQDASMARGDRGVRQRPEAGRQTRRGGRGRCCTRASRPSRPTWRGGSRCAGCGTSSNTAEAISATCRTGGYRRLMDADGLRRRCAAGQARDRDRGLP